ncbi:MAG: DUF6580 family putative transport protein [Chitinophagales bacterium]|nr:DUF6580 family putative transport protein [Chitinophagales bacterium]
MRETINLRFGLLALLIFVAAFSRILPHMPNFSPLGAIGLFGAAYFTRRWQAFLVPILATWLSDLYINNVIYNEYYPNFTWFYEGFYWQYGSYVLITLCGIFIFKKVSPLRVLVGALAATVIFFIVSNFGCWLGSSMYPQNMQGLMMCYVAGLPFLKGTLLGNLFYSMVLFGLFWLAQIVLPQLRLQKSAT